jgi:hypothetical protein
VGVGVVLVLMLINRATTSASSAFTAATQPLGAAAAVAGAQGVPGKQGAPGKPGKPGAPGKPGVSGKPGLSTGFVYRTVGTSHTFAQIARAYGVSLQSLTQANPNAHFGASHPNARLKAGTSVLIPRSRQSVVQLRTYRRLHPAGKIPAANTAGRP